MPSALSNYEKPGLYTTPHAGENFARIQHVITGGVTYLALDVYGNGVRTCGVISSLVSVNAIVRSVLSE